MRQRHPMTTVRKLFRLIFLNQTPTNCSNSQSKENRSSYTSLVINLRVYELSPSALNCFLIAFCFPKSLELLTPFDGLHYLKKTRRFNDIMLYTSDSPAL